MRNYLSFFAAKLTALCLLAIVFCVATARSDIHVNSTADANNVATAVVDYFTGAGLVTARRDPGSTISYGPDGQPGHLFFFSTATAPQCSSTNTADAGRGILRSYSTGSGPNPPNAGGQSQGALQITDNITFTNTSSQILDVTVQWKIEGTLSSSPATNSNGFAEYVARMTLAGGGHGGRFSASGHRDSSDATRNFENASADWGNPGESYQISPNGNGLSGAVFTGHLALPPGQTSCAVDMFLSTDARYANSSANFGNTSSVAFTLPAGVSFTSQSGFQSAGSRLVNISTRARVLGGDSVAIGGFIITGNAPKKVIIRGIGPSLSAFGVANPLPNPTLQLNHDGTVVASNNDWKDTQQTEIQNSGLAPTNNLESAIVRTLDPGNYTAVLRDKDNAVGIGVVQVFDLDAAADSKLANISTRAFIEPGDNVLFGGIIGGGNGSQPSVLIVARGPSLANFGVPNPIPDPLLELHNKDGVLIATNNDWQSDQKAAIEATGVAPPNPKESALLVTLRPAENYTAIIKDATNTSGVALVEVYHLQ
jgi:hypothetical protein